MKTKIEIGGVCFILLAIFLLVWGLTAKGQIYAPADSILLSVGTTDTTLLTVADADSIWFKWGRVQGTTFTLADSVKITTSFRTGGYGKKIKASAWTGDSTGSMFAQAVAYKTGKTGIKTWSWVCKKTTPDSVIAYLIAMLDVKTSVVRDTAHNAGVLAGAGRDTSALIHGFLKDSLADTSEVLMKRDTTGSANYLRTKTIDNNVIGANQIAAGAITVSEMPMMADYFDTLRDSLGNWVGAVGSGTTASEVMESLRVNHFLPVDTLRHYFTLVNGVSTPIIITPTTDSNKVTLYGCIKSADEGIAGAKVTITPEVQQGEYIRVIDSSFVMPPLGYEAVSDKDGLWVQQVYWSSYLQKKIGNTWEDTITYKIEIVYPENSYTRVINNFVAPDTNLYYVR